ncbi:hypothetical protein MSG28_014388 [Choristoneura fumiferana]|uniref:Uncharacterized protein n=1 Tax=Choristoneura fumiferana TaxID=7141 RepID=A0ACC0JRW9_CHOFU|nr:hypothetical protein MSG28_014388 [Choristoneura fumiferana]
MNVRRDDRTLLVLCVGVMGSSVPPGREYTSLEDHAIVAWVSTGDRERRVNGNALWRELQADYKRITGQDRSWHSLRNRYLRYVLPSLGRLALPPQQVSRLRAAAAAGQLKTGGPPRRNSIYGAPVVRSASARARDRPNKPPAPKRPADEPPPDKHTPPKGTLLHSLTFHRAARPPAEEPPADEPPPDKHTPPKATGQFEDTDANDKGNFASLFDISSRRATPG